MAAQRTRSPRVTCSAGLIRLPKHNTEQLTSRHDAVRFAIEQLPPEQLAGAYLEVNDARFGSREIRRLYDSAQYPLALRVTG